MKVDFEKLIKIAPFDEPTREKILSQKDSLTPDQILRLEEVAWTMLASVYQAKIKKMTDEALYEMAQGKKTYNKSDFAEMQTRLYLEFAKQLEMTESSEAIQTVKQELQKFQPVQPPTTPANQL